MPENRYVSLDVPGHLRTRYQFIILTTYSSTYKKRGSKLKKQGKAHVSKRKIARVYGLTSRWCVLLLWASFILSPVLLSDYEVVREPELLEDPPSQPPPGDLLDTLCFCRRNLIKRLTEALKTTMLTSSFVRACLYVSDIEKIEELVQAAEANPDLSSVIMGGLNVGRIVDKCGFILLS
jgi:hypothetical protein